MSNRPHAFLLAGAEDHSQPNLFSHLNENERQMVLSLGRQRVVPSGKMLFCQGEQNDGLFILESGLIRVFYLGPSGREITLAYWYPGNFVGAPEVFGAGVHFWSGVAAQKSTVLALSSRDLRMLVARIPALALGIIDGLVFKGKCYSALAQMLGTLSVTERLAQLLLSLAHLYGVPESGGIVIKMSFSHEELARMVGATRQWVTATLKRFATRGILRIKEGRIVIVRPELLSADSWLK